MRLVSVLYENHHPWEKFFPQAELVTSSHPDKLREKDILILHGGGDISPHLYNKRPSTKTYARAPSQRDLLEWDMLQRAKELKVPIIGICRGGQMLCAAAGGFLVQHVDNHSGVHQIKTDNGELIHVNSIHHQMMVPWNTNHKLLAWSAPKRSPRYVSTDEQGDDMLIEMEKEPELIYFPDILGMAIQWHPEMMASKDPSTAFIMKKFHETF